MTARAAERATAAADALRRERDCVGEPLGMALDLADLENVRGLCLF